MGRKIGLVLGQILSHMMLSAISLSLHKTSKERIVTSETASGILAPLPSRLPLVEGAVLSDAGLMLCFVVGLILRVIRNVDENGAINYE